MEMKYLIRAWALLALLPIINAFSIVITYGANRPHIEEFFSTALVAIAAHDGTLTLSQLLEPVNEHPYFFTKLILALHTNLTRFDLRVDMFLSVVMNTAIFLVLFWWLWKQDRRLALVVAPFLSLLVLTPAQAINWLIAFQNIFFISVLFLVLILSVISYLPIGWRAMVYAMILALAGSFSMGIAPALWAAPLPTLWIRGYRNWRHYVAWLASGGAVISYFATTTKPLTSLSLAELDRLVSFGLAYLGSVFSGNNTNTSIFIGVVGMIFLALNTFLLWLLRPSRLSPWVSLATFSIVSSLMVSYSRGSFGVSYALQSRYVTHSMLLWAAVLVISAHSIIALSGAYCYHNKVIIKLKVFLLIVKVGLLIRWLRSAHRVVSIVSAVGMLAIYFSSSGSFWLVDSRESLSCILEFPVTRSDCLKEIAFWKDQLIPMAARIDQLAARQLGSFAYHSPVRISNQSFFVRLEELWVPEGDLHSGFRQENINGRLRSVLFQHPPRSYCCWTTWFQYIDVPAYFESEIYVLPAENPERFPVDGVTFRVYAQARYETERMLLFEKHFDPTVYQKPLPIRVSLKPFRNRMVHRLHIFLETDIGSNSYYDWAVWIEPRFVLELSEEAARAAYYPPR